MMSQQLKTADAIMPIQGKWGSSVDSGDTGFVAIPDMLIKHQVELGLDAMDMIILLNIVMHWWKPNELPHPRLSSISKRIGVNRKDMFGKWKTFV